MNPHDSDAAPTAVPPPPPLPTACRFCGTDITGLPGGMDCPGCGRSVALCRMPASAVPVSGHAIASLICGVMVFMIWPLAILFAPAAVILARRADEDVARGLVSPGSQTLATIGRVCGYIGLAIIGLALVVGLVALLIAAAAGGF